VNVADRVSLPGPDEQGALDRRYDVRIARRLQDLLDQVEALEARVAALE